MMGAAMTKKLDAEILLYTPWNGNTPHIYALEKITSRENITIEESYISAIKRLQDDTTALPEALFLNIDILPKSYDGLSGIERKLNVQLSNSPKEDMQFVGHTIDLLRQHQMLADPFAPRPRVFLYNTSEHASRIAALIAQHTSLPVHLFKYPTLQIPQGGISSFEDLIPQTHLVSPQPPKDVPVQAFHF